MDESIEVQIAKAVHAQLEVASVTVRGVVYPKPEGLWVELERVADVGPQELIDKEGPFLNVVVQETGDFSENGEAQLATLLVRVEGALLADDTSPIVAVDSLRLWVNRALQANRYLDTGGVRLSHGIRQSKAEIYHSLYPQSKELVSGFDHTYRIPYHSRVDDPAARS